MKRKYIITISAVLLFLLLVFLLRYPILRAAGNYLTYEDALHPVPVMFVLSGGAYDRGQEAAKLFHQGYADRIICTGENIPPDFKVFDMEIPESELTRLQIIKAGVPESKVDTLLNGTSTKEESAAILAYCRESALDTVMVVSTKFHTRRIKQVFKDEFMENNITVIIRGAPSSIYNEQEWWKNEYGLIALNNEYIKKIYYLFL